MSDIEIYNSNELYEIKCRDCEEIVIILEIKNDNASISHYLCDHCSVIDNENRLAMQNGVI